MEKQPHDKFIYQPSLFTNANSSMDEELNTAKKTLERSPHPTDNYIALDRLLDAIEEVLHSGYPTQ